MCVYMCLCVMSKGLAVAMQCVWANQVRACVCACACACACVRDVKGLAVAMQCVWAE